MISRIKPAAHQGEAENLRTPLHRPRRRLHQVFVELAGSDEPVVLDPMLAL